MTRTVSQGIVDTTDDHFKLYYEECPEPVALVGRTSGDRFVLQFLPENLPKDDSTQHEKIVQSVTEEAEFYLVQLRERDPWKYAIYHCSTASNIYPHVHWGYFPKKPNK